MAYAIDIKIGVFKNKEIFNFISKNSIVTLTSSLQEVRIATSLQGETTRSCQDKGSISGSGGISANYLIKTISAILFPLTRDCIAM